MMLQSEEDVILRIERMKDFEEGLKCSWNWAERLAGPSRHRTPVIAVVSRHSRKDAPEQLDQLRIAAFDLRVGDRHGEPVPFFTFCWSCPPDSLIESQYRDAISRAVKNAVAGVTIFCPELHEHVACSFGHMLFHSPDSTRQCHPMALRSYKRAAQQRRPLKDLTVMLGTILPGNLDFHA